MEESNRSVCLLLVDRSPKQITLFIRKGILKISEQNQLAKRAKSYILGHKPTKYSSQGIWIFLWGFPGGASKESSGQCRVHRRREFDPWVREVPWRRKRQFTPVFLSGKPQREGLQATGPHRVGHNRARTHTGTTEKDTRSDSIMQAVAGMGMPVRITGAE